MKDLLLCVHVAFNLEISRLRQRIQLKCVPHVQHNYFSIFNQSDHWFLGCRCRSGCPCLSSLFKMWIANTWWIENCSLPFVYEGDLWSKLSSYIFPTTAKNRSKKHQIFEKWEHFENRPSCKGYSPCKILTLAQKLKFQKTCQTPFYKSFRVVLCKKPLRKTPNIREMRAFWKSVIMQRLQPMQNPHFGSKIKIPKNMSKSILQIIYSCSVQKTAPKNTKYSRNESILKIGHHAKAIAHAKSSLWLKN